MERKVAKYKSDRITVAPLLTEVALVQLHIKEIRRMIFCNRMRSWSK